MGETKDDRQPKIEPVNTGHGTNDLPDPPDWLGEETARRDYLKRLALSDEPALPELEELAPEPDGPDLEP